MEIKLSAGFLIITAALLLMSYPTRPEEPEFFIYSGDRYHTESIVSHQVQYIDGKPELILVEIRSPLGVQFKEIYAEAGQTLGDSYWLWFFGFCEKVGF